MFARSAAEKFGEGPTEVTAVRPIVEAEGAYVIEVEEKFFGKAVA